MDFLIARFVFLQSSLLLRQLCGDRAARLAVQLQQRCRALLVEALHAPQFPADGAGAHADEVVQLLVGLAEALLHLGKALPELVELGLHRAQQLPDLAGALLDGEGLEAHL